MFADPAEPGALGERFLEHRRAVDEDAVAEGPDGLLDPAGEFFQPGPQHLVVVAPQGIARDVRFLRMIEQALRGCRLVRQVVHAGRDHARRALDQQCRTAALRAVLCHVLHLAVKAFRQPVIEPCFGDGQVDTGDTDLLESELGAPATNVGDELRGIDVVTAGVHGAEPVMGPGSV